MIHHLHREELVLTGVARGDTLIHSLGVNKQLEGRTRLTHSGNLVVLPGLKVNVAHPSLYVSGLRLDGHKAAVHKALHVAQRVECRNLLLDIACFAVVVEQAYLMRQVQIVIDRVLITLELMTQKFIIRCLLSQILDKVGNLNVALVLPRICAAPVRVKALLHLLHLLYGSLFGILLHARVECGVNLQSLGVVGVFVVLAIVVGTPALHPVAHSLAEVVSLAVVGILYAVIQLNLQLLQRVALLLSQVAVLLHQVEHDVTALQRVVGVNQRVIVGGSLQHSNQYGSILNSKLLWRAAKVGFTSCLDTECVRTKVNGVSILCQYLVLIKEELQLVGCNPLLTLQYEHFNARDVTQQTCRILRTCAEQVLGQLLCDGRCATGIVMQGVIL